MVTKIKNRLGILYRKYGWKAVVAVFLYYLVRDVTLYIIVPYFIIQKTIGD
ncbi:MAG: hypothetical protein NZ480_08350 [Bdellovibrionaceae bacterium]|nr:hypothetical protein [Pseudobdellovibrionaceae bacterium]MDW8190617.1 hypothetical protein [Pseudobdellovibrionaceae bacterium]